MTAQTKAKLIVFLNTLTLIGGAVTIILILRVITNTARLNTETNNKIVASQKVTENELRCLAAFFSQTGRQNLRINNLETCEILHTDTGQTEVLPLSPTPQSSAAVPSSDTTQKSTTNPTPTQENTPASGDQTTSQTAPSQTASQLQGSANPQQGAASAQVTIVPPKELLGIPICVPFTGVCVR